MQVSDTGMDLQVGSFMILSLRFGDIDPGMDTAIRVTGFGPK